MRAWSSLLVILSGAGLLNGCWYNDRQYPFLSDARSAKAAGDPPRALGAARALLDNQRALESPKTDIEAAEAIASAAQNTLLGREAEKALERAASLPKTRDGLAESLALLTPILDGDAELALRPYRPKARTLLSNAYTPFWDRIDAKMGVETYDAAFAAVEKATRQVEDDGPLLSHVAESKLRIAKVHEERAEATVEGPLGVAQRWWHLTQANRLGAHHDVRADDATLVEAFSVATTLASFEPNSKCATARSDIERLLAPRGKSSVSIAVRVVDCNTSTSTDTQTRTRQGYKEVTKDRYVKDTVQVGTRVVKYKDGQGEHCSTAYDTRTGRDVKAFCGYSEGVTMTREEPVYDTVMRREQYVERVPVDIPYEIVSKTKNATIGLEVTATFPDGRTASRALRGAGSFTNQETRGDAGEFAKSFSREPPDRELFERAQIDVLGSLGLFLSGQKDDERERILQELRRASTEPGAEEAYRAAQVWARGPGQNAAKAWLAERWGGKEPTGELRAAIADVGVSFTPTPITAPMKYDYDRPEPVGYLNTAHGAGWLVTTGASLEMGAQETAIDSTQTQVWLGGSFGMGGRKSALRFSAAGSSTSILGDVNGYALGAAYARSLRGDVSDHHRLELVWSLGLTGGATEVDAGLASSPEREKFVRVPIALTASVPFYLVSFQARAAIEPNLYALFPEGGTRTPHLGSLWLGVLPVPWIVVEGGAEMALESSVSGPLFGVRTGVRL